MKTSFLVIMLLIVIPLTGCKKDNAITNTTPAPAALLTDWVDIVAGPYSYGPGDTLKTIAYNFKIMKYEVTNAQYLQYLNEALAAGEITLSSSSVQGSVPGVGPGAFYLLGNNTTSQKYGQIYRPGGTFLLTPDSSYANHPVVYVTWAGAWAFAKHYSLRLPTEQEWEKTARGTTGFDFPWGNSVAQGDANFLQSGDAFTDGTTPVGYYNGAQYGNFHTSNRPGPYGAYDMVGNVFEWTESFFGGSAPTERVFRGGSWDSDGLNLRSWSRFYNTFAPLGGSSNIGFRCVKDL
jgi:formylglycine-generating enzyme required for sulfatase activity